MKYSILPTSHSITFKGKKYKFKSPYLWTFLEFNEIIESGEIKLLDKAIDLIIDINVSNIIKLAYATDIIDSILKEIFPESKTGGSGGSKHFFPATIDYFSTSYGVLPEVFLKKTTVNQLQTWSAAKEWNNNIKNDKEELNIQILTRQLGDEAINEAKDRIRLRFNTQKNGK